ncbi:MAG: acyl-CoA thioesterase [Geobacter sp.]|nr:acyl-CoA thioesterase [Geobacter sp.]
MRVDADKRSDYRHFHTITTRWMDNDIYGHVYYVIYYSWFDTAVNQFLIANDALDIVNSPVIGLVIETQCSYFAPLAFPDVVTIGVRVARLGKSSVRYEVGVFRNDEDVTSARGHFVHVYVDRESRRPVEVPGKLRRLLQTILKPVSED